MSGRYWVVVASRDHALHGVAQGIVQVNHGKPCPLRLMQPGDGIILYAPKLTYDQPAACQCFVALGEVSDEPVFQVYVEPGFEPFRRMVHYQPVTEVAIQPLLAQLTFIQRKERWGYSFRFGCFNIPAVDFALIRATMVADHHE
ncbi:EVE domain-containing protein [Hymenobacter negativus]|uniref:UPF0310 protein J4E00_00985 n=1 Tax=Hymenobacter negativus TaxID=2795026 RepID=A0ABS3Q8N3_9BACT|nr:EVE domain-containing protein [Hymenobacter negativus]MBO2007605.1 EVE domain-containing protein [Hymenobacter negativus]